mgnify:FL=1|tara:strand:+ start:57 stop:1082 length:1026 start_codon:yes stop_codon:yes gene_type:complete
MTNFSGVVILGDIMLGRNCTDHIIENGLDSMMSSVVSQFKDFALIANLESPLFDSNKTIENDKVSFKAPTQFAKLLKQQHISALSLANNHIFDYGLQGFLTTLKSLEDNNINYFGAGLDHSAASKPCIFNIKDKKVGLIGLSYHPIAKENHYGVNNLYGNKVNKQIKELEKSVDFVIIMPHSGIELLEYPLPRDQKLYRSMINSGADLIVGNHPHRVQVMETWNSKRIYYSIGDFIFDHHNKDVWNNFWLGKAHPKKFSLKIDKRIPLESLIVKIEWNSKKNTFEVSHIPILLNKDNKPTILETKKSKDWENNFKYKNQKFLIQNAMHKKAKSIQRNLKLK